LAEEGDITVGTNESKESIKGYKGTKKKKGKSSNQAKKK